MLEVKGARYSYNGVDNIFSGIDLELGAGEIVCILGPNGAGKSTLLKCINRILTLNEGEILWKNDSLLGISQKKMGTLMEYVSQAEEASFPFSSHEMVLMGRAAYLNIFKVPAKKDWDIAGEALRFLGIEHLASRIFNDLSGGESQLVTIARALAAEPRILLLDEPTSHLDLKNQMIIFKALVNLAREKGLAILMTSHQPDHAMIFADRVLMMKRDGSALFGDTESVLTVENIRNVFGLEVTIIPSKIKYHRINTIVPDWSSVLSHTKI